MSLSKVQGAQIETPVDIAGVNLTGVSTAKSLLVVGSGTTSGTADQPLQVLGGTYISGSTGIGLTNPDKKFVVNGTGGNYVSEFYNTNDASSNNGVYIRTENTAATTQPLNVQGSLYVTGDGNIGVGTVTPLSYDDTGGNTRHLKIHRDGGETIRNPTIFDFHNPQ